MGDNQGSYSDLLKFHKKNSKPSSVHNVGGVEPITIEKLLQKEAQSTKKSGKGPIEVSNRYSEGQIPKLGLNYKG